MNKKCIVCCLLVFSIVFSVLIFSSCTSSKSKPETITLNAVYDSTEIILDEKFTSIFDFKFYDNIYLCGQIDDFVAFASINASDISYLTTDVPAPAIGFCKTNDAYIVITSLLKPNSEYVSYILHLVSEQGITLSVFEIPAIINENEEFRMMKLTLELAKESDDELWRELILLHLDDMKILNSKDKEKIKKKFEGNL